MGAGASPIGCDASSRCSSRRKKKNGEMAATHASKKNTHTHTHTDNRREAMTVDVSVQLYVL